MIAFDHLTKRFGDVVAVDDLTLEIGEGEFFGLLGPNGAGKSTALMMLTTLLRPTTGAARVHGFDVVRDANQVRRTIGIVFQDPSSDDTLTGYENLKLHGMLYGMERGLRERRIADVLELVDLADRQRDIVKHYSGGMRRRLELARGLMHRPTVLLLDEPTLGLDPQTREHIWAYVERLVREERITVVLTTHYMEEADRLCTRLAIIDQGRIAALGTPTALKQTVGGDMVTLGIRAPNLDAARALDGIETIVSGDGVVRLTVRDARARLPHILQAIGPVDTVEVRPASRDDVFMHYTGREMRESAAEGGWAERSMRWRSGGR